VALPRADNGTMDDRLLEHQDTIRAFLDVARRFCDEVEHAADSSDIEFLRRMLLTLPELYWRGQTLPVISPWADDDDEEEDEEELETEQPAGAVSLQDVLREAQKDPRHIGHMGRYTKAHDALAALLEGHDFHCMVFDPYSPEDRMRESIPASISDHLADVYSGIYDQFDEEAQVNALEWNWHWRWAIEHNWGQMDILPALRAIAWLVDYWDDDEQTWRETWNPPPHSCSI
jgi:hypothetical protein